MDRSLHVASALITGDRYSRYVLPEGGLISAGAVWYVLTMKKRTYTAVGKNGLMIHGG
ncbi:hypothetical protein [Halobacillus kuroshimensis]|uniref:hypothetical protein n=1 Tax=Halobacillus kuroshimensis TaxID=302481 RepID=UPI00040C6961|nr:hypothetical protein [Halobacillus kuroshimensis]